MHAFAPTTRQGPGSPGLVWVVLDGHDATDQAWLASQSGLDDAVKEIVAKPPTRSDRVHLATAIVLTLVRKADGGNQRLAGLEIVVEPHRIVTVCYGIGDLVDEALERQVRSVAPIGTGRVLALLVAALVKPLEEEVTRLSDRIDGLEDAAMKESGDADGMDDTVVLVGRHVLDLRRYLAPIHDELAYLALNPDELPGQADPSHLRRAAESLARLVTALDQSNNRVLLILNQLRNRDASRQTRSMHKLTLVATVFLPLSFITGLLGINVAGIPEAHYPYAFWVVCGVLLAVAVAAILLIRWRRWM